MAPLFQTKELLYIAPEILLATWGLLVLIADFAFLRKMDGPTRVKVLGRVSLVGTFLALILAILSIVPRSAATNLPFLGGFALDLSEQDWGLFAGTLAADSATAVLNILILGLLLLVIGLSMTWGFTEHWGEYFALLLWASVGMMLLVAAEELLTLFLTLETMTLCLYMMAAFEKTRRRSAEAGLKYFVYGSVSSALFLFGLSLLYGLTGSTRFEAIRSAIGAIGAGGLKENIAAATALLLIMVGFGFKIAAVPFQQWAPDTYEGAPAPVTAWIAAGSKIASFVALMKVLLGALPFWAYNRLDQTAGLGNLSTPGWIGVLAVISAISMTYGNFAALAQKNLKRMLAYSSIAHAGYMLVGVLAAAASVNKSAAAGAVLFYLVVYSFTTVGALAVAAWLARDKGSRRHRRPQRPGGPLARVGGLHPPAHAFADRHAAAGRVLRQVLHVHGSHQYGRSADPRTGSPGRRSRGWWPSGCSIAWSRPSTMCGSSRRCSSVPRWANPCCRPPRA